MDVAAVSRNSTTGQEAWMDGSWPQGAGCMRLADASHCLAEVAACITVSHDICTWESIYAWGGWGGSSHGTLLDTSAESKRHDTGSGLGSSPLTMGGSPDDCHTASRPCPGRGWAPRRQNSRVHMQADKKHEALAAATRVICLTQLQHACACERRDSSNVQRARIPHRNSKGQYNAN